LPQNASHYFGHAFPVQPPESSVPTPELPDEHNDWLTRLRGHLKEQQYGTCAPHRISATRRFLEFLWQKNLTVGTVEPADIEKYLNALRSRRKSGRHAVASKSLRAAHRAAIHILLRMVHGRWPLAPTARCDRARFHEELISGYSTWMRDLRGLSESTRSSRCAEARRFLDWLGERSSAEPLASITVADIDAYIRWRATSLQRRALKSATQHLRSFLRQLHGSGRAPDLAAAVISPKVYTFEGIPSALRREEIDKVLRCTREDRRPVGLRDYAMLLLLATYGLRAGEVVALRLEDIDWGHDRLQVRHSKTGAHSELPLLQAPGEAILEYLRRGRPKTHCREIFVRAKAPYRAFRSGTLYAALQERLKAAGVTPRGKSGAHAFRHARAVSLLKRDTPLKVIGDVLGHRSMQSTMTYLKLDAEALRDVALEIPVASP
jgi:site-specific recombinase XerD